MNDYDLSHLKDASEIRLKNLNSNLAGLLLTFILLVVNIYINQLVIDDENLKRANKDEEKKVSQLRKQYDQKRS